MSLRTRLLASYTLIVLVCLVTIALALAFFLRNSPIPRRLAFNRLNEAARDAPAVPSPDSSDATWQDFADRAAAATGVRVIVVDETGQTRADSDPNANHRLPAESLRPPPPGAATPPDSARDVIGREWLFVARRAGRAVVLFAEPLPRFVLLAFIRDNLLAPIVQAGLTALCLSFVLAFLIARSVAEPLRRMARAADGIAHGQYDGSLPRSGPSEVQTLAGALDDMARQIKSTQQAQRDFVANVSHELKTPLTSIQGFAQAILDGAAESPAQLKRSAGIIYDEAERMRRMVEGLLDLARIEAGQIAFARGPVDVAALLRSIAEKMSLRAGEKNIALKQEIDPLPTLVGDGDRLAQVFTNLVDNALKHTPSGGGVTIRALPAPGGVEVNIADTGLGIPPDDLSRIFERFYQVDKSRKGGSGRGAGLGLAITKEIVAAHGGTIRAESVIGLGTKFVVTLPSAQAGDATVARRR